MVPFLLGVRGVKPTYRSKALGMLSMLAFGGCMDDGALDSGGDLQLTQSALLTPATFGHKSMPQLGQRPLLTVLVNYADAKFKPEHDVAYYSKLLFGDPAVRGAQTSIAGPGGFYEQNSEG